MNNQEKQAVIVKEAPGKDTQMMHSRPHMPVFGLLVVLGIVIVIFMQTRILKEMRKK